MKTWGDVYHAACARGEDQSSAAHLADEWEKRKKDQALKPEQKGAITGATPVGGFAFIPGLVKRARELGYALTVHGSMARDFDFVAIPWTKDASAPKELAEALKLKCGGIVKAGEEILFPKPHGRMAYKFHLGGGPYVDLSIMPTLEAKHESALARKDAALKMAVDSLVWCDVCDCAGEWMENQWVQNQAVAQECPACAALTACREAMKPDTAKGE